MNCKISHVLRDVLSHTARHLVLACAGVLRVGPEYKGVMAVHHAREFGGPIGTFGVTLLLPAVVYGLYAYCDVNGCPPGQLWPPSVNVAELFTWRSNVIVFAWIMWFALLYVVVPPSSVVKGVELEDGSRLGYPINGACRLSHTSLHVPAHT